MSTAEQQARARKCDDSQPASDDCIRDLYVESGCDGTGSFVANDPNFAARSGWSLPPAVKSDAVANGSMPADIRFNMQRWQWYRRFRPDDPLAKRCSSVPFYPKILGADKGSKPSGEEFKVRSLAGQPAIWSSEATAIQACQTRPLTGRYASSPGQGLISWLDASNADAQGGLCAAVWKANNSAWQLISDPSLHMRGAAFPDRYSFFPKVCKSGNAGTCEYPVNIRGAGGAGANIGEGIQGAYDGNSYIPSGNGWTTSTATCSSDPTCAGVHREWDHYVAMKRVTSSPFIGQAGVAGGASGDEQLLLPWLADGRPNPALFQVPPNFALPRASTNSIEPSIYSTRMPAIPLLSSNFREQYAVAKKAQDAASAAARSAERDMIDATSAFAAAVRTGSDASMAQATLDARILTARNAAADEAAAIAKTTRILTDMQVMSDAAMAAQKSLGSAGDGDCQWWAPQPGVKPAFLDAKVYADAAAAGRACVSGGVACIGVWQADTGGAFHVVNTNPASSGGRGDYIHPLVSGSGVFWRKSCASAELAEYAGFVSDGRAEQKAIDDRALAASLDTQVASCAATAAQVKQLADSALTAANSAVRALQEQLDAAATQTAQDTTGLLASQTANQRLMAQDTVMKQQLVQMQTLVGTLTSARDSAVASRDAAVKQLNTNKSSCSVM